ncbi:MAG: metallophosphoesterase [Sphingobacteriia bacterium]
MFPLATNKNKKVRSLTSVFILVFLFVLIDLYFYQSVRALLPAAGRTRTVVQYGYWLFSTLVLLWFVGIALSSGPGPSALRGGSLAVYAFSSIIGIYLAKLIGTLPLLLDDTRRLMLWGYQAVAAAPAPGVPISRSTFLSWLGLGLAGTLYGVMLLGYRNAYAYQTRRHTLRLPGLPLAFDGLRVVQLSDIHAGSLGNHQAVNAGIDRVLAEQPDLILFTGDLVNDRAVEMGPWKDSFARLRAPLGVYSILGNHDYGDYSEWPSAQAKAENLQALKDLHASMGWRLLLNEHVRLKRGEDEIALVGVENWSASTRFPSHGRLAQAMQGSEDLPCHLLMSHDPSHWDAEVRPAFPHIALTLSGHTHGMQFGTENPWFRFSPVQWLYRQWAGLYQADAQQLYVNRGFGFIGYQGRVGILPEITVLTLKRA